VYLLFSGEGPTDLGVGIGDNEVCEGEAYQCGPLALIVDRMVAVRQKYSLIEAWCCGFVPKHRLVERVAGFKRARKSVRLRGKKRPQETIYFYRNARALALYAKDKQRERNDKVVAVLFRIRMTPRRRSEGCGRTSGTRCWLDLGKRSLRRAFL
jgi:hypothetical protein